MSATEVSSRWKPKNRPAPSYSSPRSLLPKTEKHIYTQKLEENLIEEIVEKTPRLLFKLLENLKIFLEILLHIRIVYRHGWMV